MMHAVVDYSYLFEPDSVNQANPSDTAFVVTALASPVIIVN